MAQRLASLAAIEAEIWQQLERAAHDKQHEWRAMVLATVDGDMADARTVILREVDVRQKQLLTFTDDRARKVAQLLRNPRGTAVMWSPTLNWQLRCRVLLSLEMTGLAATSRWARIKLTPAANDYIARLAPGSPLPASRDVQRAAASDAALKREYFAVVNAQVLSIDWMELHADGHRRAVFDVHGARWVQA
jgi:pyridoxamine 5'-phosphate oxidase